MAACSTQIMRAMVVVVVMIAMMVAAPLGSQFTCCLTESEGECSMWQWTSEDAVGSLYLSGLWNSSDVTCQSEEYCYLTCQATVNDSCVTVYFDDGACNDVFAVGNWQLSTFGASSFAQAMAAFIPSSRPLMPAAQAFITSIQSNALNPLATIASPA